MSRSLTGQAVSSPVWIIKPVWGIHPAIGVSGPAVGMAFSFKAVFSGVTPIGMAVIENTILGIAAAFAYAAFFGEGLFRQGKSQEKKQGNR